MSLSPTKRRRDSPTRGTKRRRA